MSIASMLTRVSCIRASRFQKHERQFYIRTQIQLERSTSIQLTRLNLFKLGCVCLEGIGWAGVIIMPGRWLEMVQEPEMRNNGGVESIIRHIHGYGNFSSSPSRINQIRIK
jgi:hypothetical protein